MDAHIINQLLAERVEEVCELLLPNGKRDGQDWACGDVTGVTGQSMRVNISGTKAGYWHDFACEEDRGKGLISLWCKNRGLPFKEAIIEIKEFLNINDDYSSHFNNHNTYQKPSREKIKSLKHESEVFRYLIEDRQLSEDVLKRFKICQTKDENSVAFPTIEGDECVKLKYLCLDRDERGKKDMRAEKGGKPALFGKQAVDELIGVEGVTLCEGELDALSYWTQGIPAVSIPDGVDNTKWIELDYEWLEQFESIYVSFDMDKPGKQAAQKILDRLGRERCFLVELPKKDANECLCAGIAMQQYIDNAKAIDPDEIKRANHFTAEAWLKLKPETRKQEGFDTPWKIPFKIRANELTVISGYEGSGKTGGLQHLAVHLISQGQKGIIASMEVPAANTLKDLIVTADANNNIEKNKFRLVGDWLSESLFIYDHVGVAKWQEMLKAFEYAHKKYGVFFFVIDSLLKCGIRTDDYNMQTQFVNELCTFMNKYPVHIFLVAHAKKSKEGQHVVPDDDDIKGSGDMKDLATNILIWWRDKGKGKRIRAARRRNDQEAVSKIKDQYDGKIALCKQKHGLGEQKGQLDVIEIFYDYAGQQFIEERYQRHPYYDLRNENQQEEGK